MIQLSTTSVEEYTTGQSWKERLVKSRITTKELLQHLELESHPLASSDAEKLFELRVPLGYLNKIKKKDPLDPLLLQILPQNQEFIDTPGYTNNPLDEADYSPVKGLIHKYANRVLLIASSACAINCRYCFRRTFPYEDHRQSRSDWQHALNYIRENRDVEEVILSGGDPLIQTNQSLLWLMQEIDVIKHIKRLRIHTRILTSMPERLDDELLNGLKSLNTQLVIVTHCNHPNELGEDLSSTFSQLRTINATLLNQSVLLKNINDDATTLATLSKALFQLGILPYYLFLLDTVTGTAHFNVKETDAKSIYSSLQSMLPGYLVPRLSIEIPGKPSKTLINLSG